VIEKIRKRQEISAEDRNLLSRYLSVMWARVPKYRERLGGMVERGVDPFFDKFVSQIEAFKTENPSNAAVLETCTVEVEELRERYKVDLPHSIKQDLQRPTESKAVTDLLSAMRWRFLIADASSRFIVGDNPLFYFESEGLSRKHSEVSIPISPDVLLWATWRTVPRDTFVPIPGRIVREMNRRTASFATRYVFHGKREDWVKALANRTEYDLHRLA
jgi:hypothetical protein